MGHTLQILTQIRRALAGVGENTSPSLVKSLLAAADVALNTLQLQESPEFYLGHIAAGRALVDEGLRREPTRDPSPPSAPPASMRDDESLESQIVALRASLAAIVVRLDEGASIQVKDYLVRVSDWETAYHRHNLQPAPGSAEAATGALTPANLLAYLAQRFPNWLGLQITEFTPLEGGFSKKTLLFETDDRVNGKQALVMRAEQPFDLLCYEGSDVTREFFMIQLMRRAGLPTAEPLWLEADPRHLGTRFIVSRKAEGRVYGGALGSNEQLPPVLVQSLLATFFQMHTIKIEPGDALAARSHLAQWLPYTHSLRETTRYYVTEWLPRMIERTCIPPSPQVERALKWLQRNIPDSDEKPVVMHGDFSFNNLIIGETGVSAVLDWESSRLGDPAEDIIWTQPNIGAYVDMPEFLQRYRAATGREIPEKRLAYARVVKCVLNAVACLSAHHGLETRSDTSLTLSVLAYRYMGLFGAQFNSLIESAERA